MKVESRSVAASHSNDDCLQGSKLCYMAQKCWPHPDQLTFTSGWSGATPYLTRPNGTGSSSYMSTVVFSEPCIASIRDAE